MNVTSVCQLSLSGSESPPSFDQGDFRYALDMGIDRVNVQLAELAGEVALRGGFECLILEKQHMALRQRLAQALHRALGQRAREVESRHEPADRGGQGSDDVIRGSSHGLTFSGRGSSAERLLGLCDSAYAQRKSRDLGESRQEIEEQPKTVGRDRVSLAPRCAMV